MNMTRFLIAAALTAVAVVPAAWAQRPDRQQQRPGISTLDARPNPVVFNGPVTLSGRLTGRNSGGARVQLQADATRPFGDSYQDVAQGTAERNGAFSFTVRPAANTQYRVIGRTSPPVTSAPRLVLVRPRVGLRVSDRTPSAGARVRFSGSVFPQKDGRATLVQRRSASGRWVTVARTTLRDAGDARSAYSRRVRIRRDGRYRVKVVGDQQHVNGFSRQITIDAG
jgi:hypothetical protein